MKNNRKTKTKTKQENKKEEKKVISADEGIDLKECGFIHNYIGHP